MGVDEAQRDLLSLVRARYLADSGEGERIRKAARLRRSELAAAIGVSEAAIYTWETQRNEPTGSRAIRWAQLLDALAPIVEQQRP